MRRLIWPVLFLLLLLVQGVVPVFYNGFITADLPLLGIYALGICCGEYYGAGAGFFVGLLQDALSVSVFGFHMLTRTVAGYLIGHTKGKIIREQYFYHICAIAAVSLAIRFCYWWVELVRAGGRWDSFVSYLFDSIGYCLGNMLLVAPMIMLIVFVDKWTSEDDIKY